MNLETPEVAPPEPKLHIYNVSQAQALAKKVFGPLTRVRVKGEDVEISVEKNGKVVHVLVAGLFEKLGEALEEAYKGCLEYQKTNGKLPPGVFGPGFMSPPLQKPKSKRGKVRGQVRREQEAKRLQ
jgi:hypothetical protein